MFYLALRNLWRNTRRTLITLTAISIGTASLIFIWAFIDGINEQMIVNNIQYLSGHIKVHRQGYHQDKALALAMASQSAKGLERLAKVKAVTPRVEGNALVSVGNKSATALVFGVAPKKEVLVIRISVI